MAPGATAIVLYPRTATSTFDQAYYLTTHMALCTRHWSKHGLLSYSVAALDAADAPYSHTVVMQWASEDALGKAMQDPGTKEIMADVANHSSETPVMLRGGVIGSG